VGNHAAGLTGDWNTISLRAAGNRHWLMVNGVSVLHFVSSVADGDIFDISVGRLGDVEDDTEVRVLVRNLRISPIADGDPDRAPRYRPRGTATQSTTPPRPETRAEPIRCHVGWPTKLRETNGSERWVCRNP
jgi:hypothetical protein